MDNRKTPRPDPRLHAYLDGELSPSDSAAFEGDLRPGSITANQLKTLKHLGAWFRVTPLRAPSSLHRTVVAALESEAATPIPIAPAPPSWRDRLGTGPFLRWAWIPALGAALLALSVLPKNRVLGPSDGIPPSSEHMVSAPGPQAVGADVAGPGTVRYEFTVKAARAQTVCLAGDFNDWKVCEAPLTRIGEDTWSITVDLPRGRHEYMFVIDDQWIPDPNAAGYSDDGFGSRNSLIVA